MREPGGRGVGRERSRVAHLSMGCSLRGGRRSGGERARARQSLRTVVEGERRRGVEDVLLLRLVVYASSVVVVVVPGEECLIFLLIFLFVLLAIDVGLPVVSVFEEREDVLERRRPEATPSLFRSVDQVFVRHNLVHDHDVVGVTRRTREVRRDSSVQSKNEQKDEAALVLMERVSMFERSQRRDEPLEPESLILSLQPRHVSLQRRDRTLRSTFKNMGQTRRKGVEDLARLTLYSPRSHLSSSSSSSSVSSSSLLRFDLPSTTSLAARFLEMRERRGTAPPPLALPVVQAGKDVARVSPGSKSADPT